MSGYVLYVNEARTVKVELWPSADGFTAYVATRDDPDDIWGPPEPCTEKAHDQTLRLTEVR